MTANLSDTLIRAKNSYSALSSNLIRMITEDADLRDETQDLINDLAFYMNSILEHSTPEEWTDEEYEWIESVRTEFFGAAS